jgi:YVTN family beta-propeller protein
MKKVIILICLSILFLVNITLKAQSNYRIANKFNLEGDGGWDYLASDDADSRLFISHGNVVQVMDESTGKLLGTIPDTKGVHGIAFAYELNKGFISCGRDTSVIAFNLATLETLARIKVTGINPDAILYDKYSGKVFTFNGRSSNTTVIEAKTNEVVSTIPLDGKPEFPVTDGKGKIFVNIEDKNKISLINTDKLTVEQNWSISPGEEPSGLALDNDNHILFSVCSNKLMVIVDAEKGSVITTLPIGDRCDGVAFNSGKKIAYSSNGEGTMTVVKEESRDKFMVLENFETQKSARTITVNNKTGHLYLPAAEFGPAPEPTAENPNPRPKIKSGTFVILDIEPLK